MPRASNLKRREQPEDFEAPELMFAELDGLLGYLLRRAQGAMHRDFMAAVADFELTQKQAAILWLIQANPGVSQAEVASALGMDRATMMAVTDRLENRGFTIRKRSSTDRRRQELYLTPAGQGTLRKCKSRIAEHEEKFRKMFTAGELAAFLEALKKFQSLG
jgi:DNA-binding MarR family transcriptional regulator